MKNYPVLELMGLIAVFAGLVFVGFEIRQNNQLAQAAPYQEIGFATAQNWKDMSQDPEFNRIYLRYFYADATWWAEQHPRDVERLLTLWISSLRQYETIHLQVDLGLLDTVAMERLCWGFVREIPALRHLWPQLGLVVTPGFADYITEEWPEVPPLATGFLAEQ